MKKIVSILLSILIVASVIPMGLFTLTASAVTSGTTGDCAWSLNGTVLTISGNGRMANQLYGSFGHPWDTGITEVIIGDGVTEIGDWVFYYCRNLTKVTFGSGLTHIGERAFKDCTALETIVVPANVTSIGFGAFEGCSNLKKITVPFVGATQNGTENVHFGYVFGSVSAGYNSSYVPESLKDVFIINPCKSIGNSAFMFCSNIKNVTVLGDVETVDSYAFYQCESLQSVTLSNRVTTIADRAFYECEELTNIYIPATVQTIGDYAFNYCKKLKDVWYGGDTTQKNSITIGSSDGKLTSATWHYDICNISDHVYLSDCDVSCEDCGWIRIAPSSHVYAEPLSTECQYCGVIRDILYSQFTYENIKYMITSLYDLETGSESYVLSVVGYDGDLTGEIVIPDEVYGYIVTEVSGNAFSDCVNITSVKFGSNITYISYCAFYGCTSLETIYVPASLTYFSDDAFYGCTSLKDVWYSGSEEDRENIVFGMTNDLLVSATWHYNTVSECEHVFNGDSYIKCDVCGMSFGTTGDCTWTLDGTVLTISGNGKMEDYDWPRHPAPWDTSITKVIIENGVTSIGNYAFRECSSLTSIVIPDSVTSIGDSAFSGTAWYNNQPDGLVYAGKVAYKYKGDCPSSVTIKDGTLGIEDYAFYNCSSLTSITIPDSVTSIGSSAFKNCSSLTSIVIPNSVTSIGYGAFEYCSSLESITLPFVGNTLDGTSNTHFTYIFGASNWSYNEYDYYVPVSLKKVVISKATIIGDHAFYCCSSLTSITIPDSVTSIGDSAFSYCKSLTSITIPDGVTSIGKAAFSHCESLTSITIPDSVTSIGEFAFYGCTGLTSITLGNSVTSIGVGAFSYCESLTSVTIPDGITYIEDETFYACFSLTSINIPENVTKIGDLAFECCYRLTTITVDADNTTFSSQDGVLFDKEKSTLVFYPTGKTASSYTIPDGVTSIGDKAFYECSKLVSVTIPNGVTSIGEAAFYSCNALTNIYIPNGVTSIGDYTFGSCTSLISITIPKSVTSVGYRAFDICDSLENVYYGGSATDREKITIDDRNDYLLNATWHYNTVSECEHTYDNACDTTCNTCGDVRTVGAHKYGSGKVTTKATCTKTGVKIYTCTECGDTKTETIAKLSHTSDNGTVTKKATCTATGTKTYKCTECGTTTKTETLAKLSHTSDKGTVTKKATCTATGTKTYKCTVCGTTTKTETIKATGHSYADATCTAPKTCKTCKATSGKALGHKYSNDCDTTCNTCGAKRTIKHTYKLTTTKKATLTANGKQEYKCTECGYITKSNAKTIYSATSFKLSKTSYTYNGKVQTPTVTVKDSKGNTLKKGTDYDVTYASGRKNVGTYKVTIKMKGKYSGTKTLTFKINPIKITTCKVSISATSFTYTGSVKKPTAKVVNANGTTLKEGTHYTVTYDTGRKNVGTYKVVIKMKGNYSGQKTLTFRVNPAKTTVSKVTPATKKLTVSITKKTAQVTGYEVQYSTSKSFTTKTTKTKIVSKNSITKATITGLKAKTTYYVRVRTYKTVSGKKYYSAWSVAKSAKTK